MYTYTHVYICIKPLSCFALSTNDQYSFINVLNDQCDILVLILDNEEICFFEIHRAWHTRYISSMPCIETYFLFAEVIRKIFSE